MLWCRKKINKNSLGIDLGYIIYYGSPAKGDISIPVKNVKGFYSNIEYRHYYHQSKRYKFYYGVNFVYQNSKTTREEEILNYTINPPYATVFINNYIVVRELYAAHIKAGIRMQYHNFVFDPTIGIGVRYITSTAIDKVGTDNGEYEIPYNKPFDNGSKWFPSINYNFKIGYVF